MIEFTDEQIETSRKRLNLPADWEWYSCSNDCGDLVWTPPGTGDVAGVSPVCSVKCLHEFMIKKGIQ